MKLSVFERLLLLNIFNGYKSDITNSRIVKEMLDSIGFSEEDHKNLQIRMEEGKVKWQREFDIDKEIKIGEKAKSLISHELEKLNKQGLIGVEHVGLYDKFEEKE